MNATFRHIKITFDLKTFALGLGLILGGFVRLEPVLSAAFPLKDGGLFFTFIDQIQQNQFSLPHAIAYNGLTIPFAYPPLSFYVSAFISSLFNISTIELLKFLPAIFSILTIPVFYFFASTILESERQVCFAVISFALLPTAIDFMIVGGGLPRSLGYVFAILALQQTWRLFTQSHRRHLIWSVFWTGLTILSHPVVAKFLVYSSVLIFLFKGRTRKGFTNLLGIAVGAALLTSPWWLLVISRHGIAPYLNAIQAAPQSWVSYLAVFLFMQTNEPYLHIQGILALFGIFACLNSRKFFLPAWMGSVFLLEPRLVASYAIIPTALLAAAGIDTLVTSMNSKINKDCDISNEYLKPPKENANLTLVSKFMLGFFLIYGLVSAYISAPRQYLSAENIAAMTWIKNHVPAGSNFLVISGINGAGEDYISEWFPALSGSASLATPQGWEWLSSIHFINLWKNYDLLQNCIQYEAGCLEDWAIDNQVRFKYVYLDKSSAKMKFLNKSLKEQGYKSVFDNSGVIIFYSAHQ